MRNTPKSLLIAKLLTKLIVLVLGLHIGEVLSRTPDFKCKGERIEKHGVTWGYARAIDSGYRLEKASNTIGWIKKAGPYWRIETTGGSTVGWLKGIRIETPAGASWIALNDYALKVMADCPAPITAGLWVLAQGGDL